MKKFVLALILMSSSAFAQDVIIPDFNWKMTEITSAGYTKEALFTKMNRNIMKLGSSICSNRALVWTHDFKRFQNIDAGKIFMFYTKKTGEIGSKTWWYHVAPVVNEKGSIFVLDAGFPGGVKGPLAPQDWLKKFAGSTNCKEIKASETDLLDRMFRGYVYPETTSYGTYDCYYKYAPAGYWTPASVAKSLLGKDENDRPVSYVRDEVDEYELMTACVEAASTNFGSVFGAGKRKCEKYLGFSFDQ